MATTASPTRTPQSNKTVAYPASPPLRRYNLIALWHLCSLDAPTVAIVWTWFIARASHISLPLTSIAAMGIAVWILYAADRLLDARVLASSATSTNDLEARHFFHHRHGKVFLTGIILCCLAMIPLLLAIPFAAIRLYLIEGSLLVGWFLLIHASRSALRLPKELAVGLFFAAAVFIPTVSRAPALRLPLILPAILFASLCSLNCLFIYSWEHEHTGIPTCAHPTTRLALAHLPLLSAALTIASLFAALVHNPIAPAFALAILLLTLLHINRRHLHRTTLRAAADLALLTPLLLILHR